MLHVLDRHAVVVQLRAQAKQCLIKHEFKQAEQLLTQGLQLTPGAYKLLRLRSVAYACLQKYQRSLKVQTGCGCSVIVTQGGSLCTVSCHEFLLRLSDVFDQCFLPLSCSTL